MHLKLIREYLLMHN